jgi:hypothetical protein
MSMFRTKIQEIERERNTILGVLNVLQTVCQTLQQRIEAVFLSLTKQEMERKMNCRKKLICV